MQTLEEEPVKSKAARPTQTRREKPEQLVEGKEKAEEKKTPFFRRRPVVIGAALVAVAAIIYIATMFLHSLTHESTDDAFIDAHIVSVAPKIAGRVSAVH